MGQLGSPGDEGPVFTWAVGSYRNTHTRKYTCTHAQRYTDTLAHTHK